MEMTARLTGDAKISTLKNDRQVVNFNVAINDSFQTKSSPEPTKIVTYVQCDYWLNTNIARYLTKGSLVELQGRIGLNAFTGKDGEAKTTLTFHVNRIKIHGSSKPRFDEAHKVVAISKAISVEQEDDLPF